MRTTIRVLVVDDNKYLADMMSCALEIHEDIQIAGVCNSGLEALDALQRMQVDVMLLDIIMPGLDGMQVLSRMDRSTADKPAVIMLTAIASDDILQRAAALGADSFLTKPVNADVIVQKIRSVYKKGHPRSVKIDI